jgi:hypothetical protein
MSATNSQAEQAEVITDLITALWILCLMFMPNREKEIRFPYT